MFADETHLVAGNDITDVGAIAGHANFGQHRLR